jgi:hypothetical protein
MWWFQVIPGAVYPLVSALAAGTPTRDITCATVRPDTNNPTAATAEHSRRHTDTGTDRACKPDIVSPIRVPMRHLGGAARTTP